MKITEKRYGGFGGCLNPSHIQELYKRFENEDVNIGLSSSKTYGYLFDLLNVPIFIMPLHARIRRTNSDFITLNPVLKDVDFYRRMDTYTAYQELLMYLSNKAYPEKVSPVLSDVLKAETHGVNKYSFRKDPTKKG